MPLWLPTAKCILELNPPAIVEHNAVHPKFPRVGIETCTRTLLIGPETPSKILSAKFHTSRLSHWEIICLLIDLELLVNSCSGTKDDTSIPQI